MIEWNVNIILDALLKEMDKNKFSSFSFLYQFIMIIIYTDCVDI